MILNIAFWKPMGSYKSYKFEKKTEKIKIMKFTKF